MNTLFEIQVRRADGNFLPTKTVLAGPATTPVAKSAMTVAQEAALAQEGAGEGAVIHTAVTVRVVDIDATR